MTAERADDEVEGALIEVERGQSESAGTVKGSMAGFGSASGLV